MNAAESIPPLPTDWRASLDAYEAWHTTVPVPGEVVQQMCDECIDATFLSDGARPHPHPFIHASADQSVGGRDA